MAKKWKGKQKKERNDKTRWKECMGKKARTNAPKQRREHTGETHSNNTKAKKTQESMVMKEINARNDRKESKGKSANRIEQGENTQAREQMETVTG